MPHVRRYCQTMKTVTVREFYHNAGLVDGLPEGQPLVVTARGKPKFVVTKGARPRMTRELAESRSIGNAKAAKFDGVIFLKSLKK
jgi:antitoxin (DNA-binding transcriptional repressor) of toxin-antitoxin stability system